MVLVDVAANEPDRGADLVGSTIQDRYEVTSELGSGGMGTVYLAHDRTLGRDVALKVHHRRSHEERLTREAQAMAKLAHPNVVTVFEIANIGDRMYVAMEYVRGTTLRGWLAAPRGWREIVDALLAAGEGLAAAHAAGLVHRDFKPENVLVGDDGRVRVSDFGLVGASDGTRISLGNLPREAITEPPGGFPEGSEPTQPAPLTGTNGVLGTRGYMAPEQMVGERVDARCDQFAFCVTAWEALYGRRPFTSGTPFTSPQVVAKRDLPPHGNPLPRVRAVLQRGLSVDPAARFADMHALLAAIRMAASNRRVKRLALAAGFAAVAAGTAVVSAGARSDGPTCSAGDERMAQTWGAKQRDSLMHAFAAINAVSLAPSVVRALDAYARDWAASYLDACQATQVRGEQSPDLLDRRMACLEHSRVSLAATVGVLTSADRSTAEKAAAAVATLPALEACSDREALLSATPVPSDAVTRARINAASAQLATSEALLSGGKPKPALDAALALVATAKEIDHKPLIARTMLAVGRAYMVLDDGPAAEKALYEGLRAAEVGGEHEVTARIWFVLVNVVAAQLDRPDEAEKLLVLAEAAADRARRPARLEAELQRTIGNLRIEQGKYEDARVAFGRAAERAMAAYGPNDPFAARMLMAQAIQLENSGKVADALAVYEKVRPIIETAQGSDHPDMVRVLENIGIAYGRLGDNERALAELNAADALAEKTMPESPLRAEVIDETGVVYLKQGRSDLAVPYFERAIAMSTKQRGLEHTATIEYLAHLGLAQKRLGQLDAAWETQSKAVQLMEKARGPDHPRVATKLQNLGSLAMERGDHATSLALHRRVRAIAEKGKNPNDPLIGLARLASANALNQLGRYQEAIVEATAAYPNFEVNEDPLNMAGVLITTAQAQIELRRAADAVASCERALKILTDAGGEPMDLAEPRFVYAQALWAAGKRAKAVTVAREVREVYAASPEGSAGVTALDEWLRAHR